MATEATATVRASAAGVGMTRAARRAGGVYYTPSHLVDQVVPRTLGPLLESADPGSCTLRVVDPACGGGAFLLGAYSFLLEWHLRRYLSDDSARARGRSAALARDGSGWRLATRERRRILLRHIFGVDIDAAAVRAAKAALVSMMLGTDAARVTVATSLLDRNLVVGDALFEPAFRAGGVDWSATFPDASAAGGFDAVVGNPPWGQKGIGLAADAEAVRYLRARFPSSVGIFDLFRPFVELSLRLLRPGGRIGVVLPDIVLLKNYEPTRRLLLDRTALDAIDWWGMRFDGAVIDAATVIATKASPAPPAHRVSVQVHDPRRPLRHEVLQADFHRNPRRTFNLFLTAEKRPLLDRLAALPRLGDFFEAHEGVHSGNMRDELFVDGPLDKTCRPLLFGRDEIAPYELRWRGRYVRLGAVDATRTTAGPRRYANVGRAVWHERPKVLVRRTGDRVMAAVDSVGRYASNNLFLVFPRERTRACGLELEGLCALLNSDFITDYFRLVEPRTGRAFAELKIKHLSAFPLPPCATDHNACAELNRLGASRIAPGSGGTDLDGRIDRLVREMFGEQGAGAEAVSRPSRPQPARQRARRRKAAR